MSFPILAAPVRAMITCWTVLAIALLVAAADARAAGIVGSKHDFSSRGWAAAQICLPCHTPHDGKTTVTEAPLWNHAASTVVYTVYSSPTMDVPVGQPGGASKLCLSCHDGTVALDAYGGTPSGTTYIAASADVGVDLSDDHPVGIRWQHQTQTPSCSNCHDPRNPGDDSLLITPFFGSPGNRTLECPTCHDVHDTSGNPPLLRITLAGSALCFYCHNK